MKKIIAILGIAALLGACLAACGAPKPEELLAGKWNASVASFEFNAFEFVPSQADPRKGTVNLSLTGSLVSGHYEVITGSGRDARDMVKITYTLAFISTSNIYYFTVDENTLSLQKEGSDTSTLYTREAAVPAPAGTTG